MFPLRTERLELRPFTPADVAAMEKVYGDPEVMRYVDSGEPKSPEQTRRELDAYIDHQNRHGFSFWAVCLRASGEVIGDAGLYMNGADVELGYTFARAVWGQGYGSEAARRCVEAARELGLTRLIAQVRAQNHASVAILRGLGFVHEKPVVAYGQPYEQFALESVSRARPGGSGRTMSEEKPAGTPPRDEETAGEGLDEAGQREAQAEDPTAPDRGFEDIEQAQTERSDD